MKLFKVKVKESEVAQSCPTLFDPVDCSLPGSSVHGILQARILEWVAISFSRGSSWPRDQTQISHFAGRRFNLWATREALSNYLNFILNVAAPPPPQVSLIKEDKGEPWESERTQRNDGLGHSQYFSIMSKLTSNSASLPWYPTPLGGKKTLLRDNTHTIKWMGPF